MNSPSQLLLLSYVDIVYHYPAYAAYAYLYLSMRLCSLLLVYDFVSLLMIAHACLCLLTSSSRLNACMPTHRLPARRLPACLLACLPNLPATLPG